MFSLAATEGEKKNVPKAFCGIYKDLGVNFTVGKSIKQLSKTKLEKVYIK